MGSLSSALFVYRAHRAWVRDHVFTNLNALLNGVPSLDTDAIDRSFQHYRGGYCHEMNTRFSRLLADQGVDFQFMGAHVYKPDESYSSTPTHTILKVTLGGIPLLCDVGFGEGFIWPLRMDRLDRPQRQGRLILKLTRQGTSFVLNHYKKGEWKKLYIFQDTVMSTQQIAEYNVLSATSPDYSPFTDNLLVTHYQQGTGRHTLFNTTYKRSSDDDRPVMLDTPASLDACLIQYFGIRLNHNEINRAFAVCEAAAARSQRSTD